MLQEIANQKGVSCRAQGWKVHLCAAQLLQLVGAVLSVLCQRGNPVGSWPKWCEKGTQACGPTIKASISIAW